MFSVTILDTVITTNVEYYGDALMPYTDRRTVISTIVEPGFKYNMLKGQLLKGSVISKNIHPVEAVELRKKQLIQRNLLKDMKTHWILRDSTYIGALMALNLHRGTLTKEFDSKQEIILSNSDATELHGKFPDRGLIVSDSKIVKKLDRDSFMISEVFSLSINKNFIVAHDGDDFRPDEKFVLEFFQQKGIITEGARHGITSLHECDIVDEKTGIQYEVIYENKNELNKKKNNESAIDPVWFIVQLVNNSFIHPSGALLNKIYKKNYSDAFKKQLIILNIGSYETLKVMIENLNKALNANTNLKNDFENIYVLTYDFISSKIHYLCMNPFIHEIIDCSNDEIGFINMKSHNYVKMENEAYYLLICKNIFNGSEILQYTTGKELREWVKELRIIK